MIEALTLPEIAIGDRLTGALERAYGRVGDSILCKQHRDACHPAHLSSACRRITVFADHH
jgi:hypothetical protein